MPFAARPGKLAAVQGEAGNPFVPFDSLRSLRTNGG